MNTTEYKQMTATHEKVNSIIKMDQYISDQIRNQISHRLREHSYTEVGRQRHEDADGRVPVRIVRNLGGIEMPMLQIHLHRQLARDALWRFKEWIWENGDETQKTYIEKISKHPRAATGWMPPAPKPVPVAVVVELLLAEPEPEPVAEPKPSLFIGLGNCGPAPVADIESDEEPEDEEDDEGRCKRKRCAFVHCSGGNSCGSYDTDDDDDDDEDDDEDEPKTNSTIAKIAWARYLKEEIKHIRKCVNVLLRRYERTEMSERALEFISKLEIYHSQQLK